MHLERASGTHVSLSVFQAGWQSPPEEWGQLSTDSRDLCQALLAICAEANQVCCSTSIRERSL